MQKETQHNICIHNLNVDKEGKERLGTNRERGERALRDEGSCIRNLRRNIYGLREGKMKMKKLGLTLLAVFLLVTVFMPGIQAWACESQEPCIDVTKYCEDALFPGDAITFSGTVTNCGNTTLWDVTVKDILTYEILLDDVTLKPGEWQEYSGSYTPTTCTSTNMVKAWATYYYSCGDYCGSDCIPGDKMVQGWAEATCIIKDCDEGCTLTPGYWKTHADSSKKKYDETWDLLPAGPDTVFFLSGQSYIEAIWENSSSGNAYYILAQAWIAARLNVMSGAFIPGDVETAWNEAMSLFEIYTPAEIDMLSGDDALRQNFLSLAGTLDDYNNGLTGPGHCD